MCAFIAIRIFNDWVKHIGTTKGGVGASSSTRKPRTDVRRTATTTSTTPAPSRTPGHDINGDTASENETDVESLSDMVWIHPKDLDLKKEEVPQHVVEKASREVDRKGADRPIREGIDCDPKEDLSEDETHDPAGRPPRDAEDIATTSEEERELPGTYRPKRGKGWWGRGEALRPFRKGAARDFAWEVAAM